MMPRDLKEQNDFVAEALELWKPNQRCSQKDPWLLKLARAHANPCPSCGAFTELLLHDIPAPDLLANLWVLVEALWRRDITVEFDSTNDPPRDYPSVWLYRNYEEPISAPVIDGNLPLALLQTAADMLRKQEK